MHSIIKQIANQLKGSLPVNDEKGYTLLFPFESSRDYYLNQSKIFKDPRDDKEYFLKFKNDEERLTEIKKINTVITSYNKVVSKNYREVLSKVPPDGKVHSNKELGFKKPVINFEEEPIWGFIVTGKSKRNGKFKLITIDNRNLYQIRLNFDSDKEFIIYLNREIFNYIQIQRKESESLGTLNVDVITDIAHWFISLQKDRKEIAKRNSMSTSQPVIFENLIPGNYTVHIVADTNENQIWDPFQPDTFSPPERRFSFGRKTSVKANFEHEIEFIIPQ